MSLNKGDNELLTRVEGDAPMGHFLRENFWFPAGLSITLKEGGAPLRVKLLGKCYVAFRSDDGRVGFLNEACPHRGVSLALARNEDNALRCIFHGWKFGVDGTTKEVPTQPTHHDEFCKKVPLKSYPIREAAGLFWVWLGSGEPKRFPDYDFTSFPPEKYTAIRQELQFNWIQSIEGLIDSSHVSELHQSWLAAAGDQYKSLTAASEDTAPVYEFEDVPGGFRAAAIRKNGAENQYVRLTHFNAPFYCFVPFNTGNCVISVPIDDVTTALYFVQYNKNGSVPTSAYTTSEPWNFPPYLEAGAEKAWGQDREAMLRGHFTGFTKHFLHEDFAVAESQGKIADRVDEFLNEGDKAIMKFRRLLIDNVREFQSTGKSPLTDQDSVPYPEIQGYAEIISNDTNWRKHFQYA